MKLGKWIKALKIVASMARVAVTRDSTQPKLRCWTRDAPQATDSTTKISSITRCSEVKSLNKFYQRQLQRKGNIRTSSTLSLGLRITRARHSKLGALHKVRIRTVSLTKSMKSIPHIFPNVALVNQKVRTTITARRYVRSDSVSKWCLTRWSSSSNSAELSMANPSSTVRHTPHSNNS